MRVKLVKYLHLSGLEPLILNENSNFPNIRERTNVAGFRKFLRLIKERIFDEAIDVDRHQVGEGCSNF
jgi:5-methyltetrahydrofolate--homocysteine methyltransferase